jgi:glycosyltransferase involved in cell wall biosynthesis
MSEPAPQLSIIIPCYHEERRLPRTLERIRAWLSARPGPAEVIVVVDGSRDRTPEVAAEMQPRFPELRILRSETNHGKGYSVRRGMLAARAPVALFTDADLSAPIEEAEKLFAALEEHDVAIGSRAVDRSLIEVHQSRRRELAGILFNQAVQLVTGLRIVDTQCGFKAFRLPRARIIFDQQRIERFGFDPEILFLARRHGLRIAEVPVRWSHDADTRVRVLRDGLRMGWDLLRIRGNQLLGRYPRVKLS